MRNLFYSLLGCLYIISNSLSLHGEIIESKQIADIDRHLSENSMILFNISSTLYAPSITLADVKWRNYFAELAAQNIQDQEAAEKLTNQVKNLIVNNIPKKPVEDYTVQLISSLQSKGQYVFGITRKNMSASYANNFGEITYNHLKSIDIDFDKTMSYLPPADSYGDSSFTLYHGIIFTNKQPEGPALISLLTKLDQSGKPSKVVMVDNSIESLKSAEDAMEKVGISFVGLRYGFCDNRPFDPDLGTIQFFEFMASGRIVSDEEAKQIKLSTPDVNYQGIVETFIRQIGS